MDDEQLIHLEMVLGCDFFLTKKLRALPGEKLLLPAQRLVKLGGAYEIEIFTNYIFSIEESLRGTWRVFSAIASI